MCERRESTPGPHKYTNKAHRVYREHSEGGFPSPAQSAVLKSVIKGAAEKEKLIKEILIKESRFCHHFDGKNSYQYN